MSALVAPLLSEARYFHCPVQPKFSAGGTLFYLRLGIDIVKFEPGSALRFDIVIVHYIILNNNKILK